MSVWDTVTDATIRTFIEAVRNQLGLTIDATQAQACLTAYNNAKTQSWYPSQIADISYASAFFSNGQDGAKTDRWIQDNYPTDPTPPPAEPPPAEPPPAEPPPAGTPGNQPGDPGYDVWANENQWPAWLQKFQGSPYAPGSSFRNYMENQYQNQNLLWNMGNKLGEAAAGTATPWGQYTPDWGLQSARPLWNQISGLQPGTTTPNTAYDFYNDFGASGGANNAYGGALLNLQAGGLGGDFLNYLQNNAAKYAAQYQGGTGTGSWTEYLKKLYGI
jgi:hypothetical protein